MYIGLDLGTSGLKGVLMDDSQRILAEARADLTVSRLHDGWSEQAPDTWLSAARLVLGKLAQQRDLWAVRGIGLSGHMHGATFLDAADRVLRPCILWNDVRAADQAARLDAIPAFRAISGNIVFPGFTAPKAVWLRENEPEIFDRVRKILLPKDYLRLWLTGEHVSDMSDAAGTSWFDCAKRGWSDELLALSGVDRSLMPALVEGSAISGRLRPDLAAEFGLAPDVVVAGGAGDNAASAIGVGVVKAGDAFVSLGTSGVLFAATDDYRPNADSAVHSFCHALPQSWHQMGVILAATDALNWFAQLVGKSAQELTANLGPLQAPSRTMFLPYLGGERTPLNDAHIRGAFLGLEHATDQMAATRAVLEGVTYALSGCQDALASTGTCLDSVLAVGGGARSDYWLSLIATILDIPVLLPVSGDYGAAFGAARLGMMAATGAGAEIAIAPEIEREFLPDTDLAEGFRDGYHRYRLATEAITRSGLGLT